MSSTTPITPNPKRRSAQKFTNELARKEWRKNRRQLSREASKREEARMEAARNGLFSHANDAKKAEKVRRENMVIGGLLPRLKAVMTTWGINVPVVAEPSRQISAWTNFSSITINYSDVLIGTRDAQGYFRHRDLDVETDPLSLEELRQVVSETRGLFYHEVGHLRFTTPFMDLAQVAHNAGFRSDMLNYREPSGALMSGGRVQWAWNCLEDQRMENAVVEESPVIAAYLTSLTLRNMADTNENAGRNYPILAGRFFLPKGVREASRREYSKGTMAPLLSDVELLALVKAYISATDASTMMECVCTLAKAMEDSQETPPSGDGTGRRDYNGGHGRLTGRRSLSNCNHDDEQEKIEQEKIEKSATDAEPQDGTSGADEPGMEPGEGEGGGQGGGEGASENDSPGDADGNSDSDQDGPPGGTGAGNGAGDHTPRSFKDEVEKARTEAEETIAQDATAKEDIASMNEYYNNDEGELGFWQHTAPTEGDWTEKAENLAAEIQDAFRVATANCAPVWQSQQRTGVLEPIRYRTRAPGDMEFRRNFHEFGDPGQDLSVKVFLDISGSMDGEGSALGSAAYAIKKSCDALNIEAEVALFDTAGYLLYGKGDRPTYALDVSVAGGTDPSKALGAILKDRSDHKNEIVLIMTDGEWNNALDLQTYTEDNRTIVLFAYGDYAINVDSYQTRYRPDESHHIRDLFDMPRILENILVSLV